ncbi:DUF4132 domain-containing protein [Rapidithrix thailandica]|uniref:DUF4132 domain-containing protein n=1 Tax=Rapidithrix thailandica TaxID=413964 RepID=A0AAW9RN50_9BACT
MEDLQTLKIHKKWQWLNGTAYDFLGDRDEWFRWLQVLLLYDRPLLHFESYDKEYEPLALSQAQSQWLEKSKSFITKENTPLVKKFLHELLDGFKKEALFWFRQGRADFICALVHTVFMYDQELFLDFVIKTTEKAFTHLKKRGSLSSSVGITGLRLMSEYPHPKSYAALLQMQLKAKHYVFVGEVAKAITRIDQKAGFDKEALLDQLVEDFGVREGKLWQKIDDYQACIEIEAYNKVELRWQNSQGKQVKREPAALKKAYGEEVKQVKALVKALKQSLSNQKIKLENAWKNRRAWAVADWERYILKHELTSWVGKKLIWTFTDGTQSQAAIWHKGQLVDVHLNPVNIGDFEKVTLWHPAKAGVEDVKAWRDFLLEYEILQPFKQAFREVYLLTEAERQTGTYSNRYSGHVLRHFKFKALAEQRQWYYTSVYSYEPPWVHFSKYGVEAVLDLANEYEFARVERLSFYTLENRQPLPLAEIDPLALSEILRDLDLFVATCSIGIEANWEDTQHREYWQHFSFGELNEVAKTRKVILESLIPRLKIKDVAAIEGRFLRIRGKFRYYKIHLGSTNILMEPNDQYLCIVPDWKAVKTPDVFLPFEGDQGLLVILSKAFLLAEDDRITDSSILLQMGISKENG